MGEDVWYDVNLKKKMAVMSSEGQNSKFQNNSMLDTSLNQSLPKSEIFPTINKKIITSKISPLI